MLNFDYSIPTKILFGKDKIDVTCRTNKKYGIKSITCLWWRKHKEKWII